MFTINRNPTEADLRKFGWAMLAGFGGLGVLVWCLPAVKPWDVGRLAWSGSWPQVVAIGCWLLGPLLLLTSRAPRQMAVPVYVTWMTLASKIGIVVATLMLTALFVVVLPLFSIVVRSGDPLRKKLKSGGSYWENYKPHEATLERMRRPF